MRDENYHRKESLTTDGGESNEGKRFEEEEKSRKKFKNWKGKGVKKSNLVASERRLSEGDDQGKLKKNMGKTDKVGSTEIFILYKRRGIV
jgi:hypothetical protein